MKKKNVCVHQEKYPMISQFPFPCELHFLFPVNIVPVHVNTYICHITADFLERLNMCGTESQHIEHITVIGNDSNPPPPQIMETGDARTGESNSGGAAASLTSLIMSARSNSVLLVVCCVAEHIRARLFISSFQPLFPFSKKR